MTQVSNNQISVQTFNEMGQHIAVVFSDFVKLIQEAALRALEWLVNAFQAISRYMFGEASVIQVDNPIVEDPSNGPNKNPDLSMVDNNNDPTKNSHPGLNPPVVDNQNQSNQSIQSGESGKPVRTKAQPKHKSKSAKQTLKDVAQKYKKTAIKKNPLLVQQPQPPIQDNQKNNNIDLSQDHSIDPPQEDFEEQLQDKIEEPIRNPVRKRRDERAKSVVEAVHSSRIFPERKILDKTKNFSENLLALNLTLEKAKLGSIPREEVEVPPENLLDSNFFKSGSALQMSNDLTASTLRFIQTQNLQAEMLLKDILEYPGIKFTADSAELVIKYCADMLATRRDLTDDEANMFKKFFFEVANFDVKADGRFEPGALKGHVDLQSFLSKHLNEYLDEDNRCEEPLHLLLEQEENNPNLANDRDHILKKHLAKAKLSLRLGVNPVPTGEGNNGAVFLDDPFEPGKMQHIAVFKAHPEYTASISGYVNWVKRESKKYVGQASLLHYDFIDEKKRINTEQFAEIAAYEFSKICGLPFAPAAKWTKFQHGRGNEPLEGAFIYFLKGYSPLSKQMKTIEVRKTSEREEDIITDQEKDQVALICAAQFALGNLDPTLNDFFVRGTKLSDITAIDFGNSFKIDSAGFGVNFNAQHNEGNYKKIPMADLEFSDNVRMLIQEMFSDKNIDKWKEELTKQGYGAFVNQPIRGETGLREKKFRNRCQMLRDGVRLGLPEFKSPATMAEIKYEYDYTTVQEKIAEAQK